MRRLIDRWESREVTVILDNVSRGDELQVDGVGQPAQGPHEDAQGVKGGEAQPNLGAEHEVHEPPVEDGEDEGGGVEAQLQQELDRAREVLAPVFKGIRAVDVAHVQLALGVPGVHPVESGGGEEGENCSWR